MAGLSGASLTGRIVFGASTATIGSFAAQLLDGPVDNSLLAIFYPSVQIAALLGGMAAAGSSAVVSALIAHLWIMPFCCLWSAYLLFFVSAGLAGAMGESLRAARVAQGAAEQPPPAGDLASRRSFEAVAATITHDVTQPLAAATAYLQTTRRLLAAEPSASVGDTLDKASVQLMRAGRIVKRLRSFLGHGPSRLAPVTLHALILDAAHSRHGALSPCLRLEASCDMAIADAAQIEELLTDILSGAERAGGATTIATFSDADAITVRIDFGRIEGIEPGGASADASLWRAIIQANQGAFRIERATDSAVAIEFALALAPAETRGPR